MLTSSELPCAVILNSCLCVLGPSGKGTLDLSKWIVEVISLASEFAGQPSPLLVRAHSTRNMAANKAFLSQVSLQEVCDATGFIT